MSLDPFETRSIDELDPMEYEAYIDHIKCDYFDERDLDSIGATCDKCGESITNYELTINNGVCPGCDSKLITDDIPF